MRKNSKQFPTHRLRILVILSGILVFCWTASRADHANEPKLEPAVKPDVRRALVENYGRLPLNFELNTGQMDTHVQFLSRGNGYSLFLTQTEAVLYLQRGGALATVRHLGPAASLQAPRSTAQQTVLLRMALVDANPKARILGLEELQGKSNYFTGNDPKKWRTNVPTYAKVKYEGIYPGVDLVYYGNQRQLEYDFVVAPGADPKAIAFDLPQGTRRGSDAKIDINGDLVIGLDGGEVRFHKPVVYQSALAGRQFVDGQFVLKDKHRIGFEVADYDRGKPLVIDPVLAYSTFYGGSADDFVRAIVVDSEGNAYLTGETNSFVDFPTNVALSPNYGGSSDAFVSKLNATGTGYVWSTYLGGSGADRGFAIALDGSGNVYVAGEAQSDDFPLKNAFQTSGAVGAAFVTKLLPSGSEILYSTLLRANYNTVVAQGIAADDAGNAYIAGWVDESHGYPTRNGLQDDGDCDNGPDNSGPTKQPAFMTKIDTTRSGDDSLAYSTLICGGPSNDEEYSYINGSGIATDGVGNAYVVGYTESSHLIMRNSYQSTCGACAPGFNSGAQYNAFVMKIDTSKSGDGSLAYSTYLGGNVSDAGLAIAADGFGHAWVAGQAASSNFPTTPGVVQPEFGGGKNYFFGDAFVAELDTTQSGAASLVWSTYLGGTGDDVATGIAVDGSGRVYVTGLNHSGGFPTLNAPQTAFGGGVTNPVTGEVPTDAFVAKLKPDGTALLYSTYLGGSDNDFGEGIAVDGGGSAYVVGWTKSADFPTHAGYLQTLRGSTDGFVAKFAVNPDFTIGVLSPTTMEILGSASTSVNIQSKDEFSSLVKFSVANVPTGISLTFQPDSVNPEPNGSASATLSMTAGPAVAAGNYSFMVRGDAGGLLVHDVTMDVYVQATSGGTTQVIGTLVALGCIDNAGVANAFSIKLAQAQAAIDAGDIQTAINILTALLQQLQAQAGKHLATLCTDSNGNQFDPAQVLIDDVTTLLVSLGANAKPNPVMGSVVNSSHLEIPGAVVSILNPSKTVLAQAKTDVTGFYFFAKTGGFAVGSDYSIKVNPPKPYKTSTPAAQTFTWQATAVTLRNFMLK